MTLTNINKNKWEKTTPYGDYNDTPDRKNSRTNNVTHILREARALKIIGKHAGSKPIKRILKAIARAHKAMAPSKVMSPEEEIQVAEEMKEKA